MIAVVAVNVRALAVIVAAPSFTRVTCAVFWPVDATVATDGSEDSHATVSVEPAGVRVAVRVTLEPTTPVEVAGATVSAVAATTAERVMVGGVSAAVMFS